MKFSPRGILIAIFTLVSISSVVKGDWMNTTNSPTTIPLNSYIEMRDYILNIDSIHPNYGEIKGYVKLALDESSAETGEFDVFLLNNINDMRCYKVAIENQKFDQNCPFLADKTKTFLKQKDFSVNYLYSNFTQTAAPYAYFIIDNTPFPELGAQPQNNLKVQSHYAAYIEPTKEYVKLVFTLGILLGCLIIFSIACVLFCLYRYRRVQADYISYKSYSQGRRNNNKSFVSSGSMDSVIKRTPFSSQIETGKNKLG